MDSLYHQQETNSYKQYLNSKSDIHFGFLKIRDSRVDNSLYETSLDFEEIEAPDQKLVLSQFSHKDENNPKEEESADFKDWVSKQIDGVKGDMKNSEHIHQSINESMDYMKENISDSYENLLAKHKHSVGNNYPHYKSNFIKNNSINESRCINTNIGKMGQNCDMNGFTKIDEAEELFKPEEEREKKKNRLVIADTVKMDFTKKGKISVGNEKNSNLSKEEAVKLHLQNTSLNISKESISNFNGRRNGRSFDMLDSKTSKERSNVDNSVDNRTDKSGSIKKRKDSFKGSVKKRKNSGLIFDDKEPNNCSIDDLDDYNTNQPKCDKNFTLSELNEEFLNCEPSEGHLLKMSKDPNKPYMSQINEVDESRVSQKTQPNKISRLFNEERRKKKESKLFSKESKTFFVDQKIKESRPLFAVESRRSDVSKYVTIDLSSSVSKLSSVQVNRPTSNKTVERLLRKGKEYEYKKELKKSRVKERELLSCTFTPELKRDNRRGGRNLYTHTTRSNCMTPNPVKTSRLDSTLNMSRPSLTHLRSKNTKKSRTPVTNKSRKKIVNSAIINRKRSSQIRDGGEGNKQRKPKWEEPTFKPKINPNSHKLAARRTSRLKNKPKKKREKSTESNISRNSENILRERLLEEIHNTLENGNFLNSEEEPCDVTIEKEDLIIILQDMELLPVKEADITEEMIMLIQAMWMIMSKEESESVNVKKMTTFILAIYGLTIMDIIEESDMCLNSNDVKQIQLGFRTFKTHKANCRKKRRQEKKQKKMRRNDSMISNHSTNDQRMADNFRQKIINKGVYYTEKGLLFDFDFRRLTHADFLRLKKEIKRIEIEELKRQKDEESMYECTFKPVINDSYVSAKPKVDTTGKSTSMLPKSFITSRVQKESTVVKLELKIKDGIKEKIYLYPNDNIDLKVEKIVKKYDLSFKKANKLKILLENQLMAIN